MQPTNNFLRRDGGNLNLDNNKIVNLSEPTEVQDATTKQYVDSRKPLITIWAQENGPSKRSGELSTNGLYRKWRPIYPQKLLGIVLGYACCFW